MGSYDRVPEDYDGPAPEHVIQCDSKWSHQPERHSHPSVELVRLCFLAARYEKSGVEVWPCSWLMEGRYDDGSKFTYDCGLPTMFTDERGSYECAGGHNHVPADLRMEQGWDYCTEDEATGLAKAGTIPVDMQGRPWL